MPITMSRRRNGVFNRRRNRKDGRSNTLKQNKPKIVQRIHSAGTPCPTPKTPTMKPLSVTENDHLGWYMLSRQSVIWDPKQFSVLEWESSGAEADHSDVHDTTDHSDNEAHFDNNYKIDLIEEDFQQFKDSGKDLLELESKPTLPRSNSLGKRNSLQMSEMVRQVSSPKRRKSSHSPDHKRALAVEVTIPTDFKPNDKVRIVKGAKKQFLNKVARIEKYLISKDKWGLCLGKNKRIALKSECLRKVVPKHVSFVEKIKPSRTLSTRIQKYNDMCTTGYIHRHKSSKLPFSMVAAIRESRLDVIKGLVMKNKCDINARNGLGQNALHMACQYDMTDCAKLLIQMGIDINALDNTQHTALMIASKHGLTDIVADLLFARAKMNFQDCDGTTALMFACQNGHGNIVDLFLQHGAYIDLENHCQQNALVLALASNNTEIAEKLMQAGLELEEEHVSDADAIHAITEGVDEIVHETILVQKDTLKEKMLAL